MAKLSSLKFWHGLLLMVAMMSFAACVDDNEDTEAPYLEVSPTTLNFTSEGTPVEGGQSSFDISTNRSWTATVQNDVSWVTLSSYKGDGSATIEVSVPAGINDEAKIDIKIANGTGVLMTKTVTVYAGTTVESEVIYNETVGTATVPTSYPYTYASDYTGWATTGTGASNVTYSSSNTTVRSSGKNNSGAYDGASGPNVVFFGTAPATFVINNIALTSSQTNLKLTFGASRSVNNNGSYDNTFDTSNFTVELSADGTSWTALSYDTNNGDETDPYWVQATSNFTLAKATSQLYIRFTAKEGSVYRLDDITLATGNGGQTVTLEGGSTTDPTEAQEITIAELISKMTTAGDVIDANADRYFEAVVQCNADDGNNTSGNLPVAIEGASKAGDGIILYGSQVDPKTLGLKQGDKVKITLLKGLAKAQNYNGVYEVTGSKNDTWCEITKTGTATVTPVVVAASELSNLSNYQGMTVTVENASTTDSGIWGTSAGTHTFTAGGTDFTVYTNSGCAFADNLIDNSKTGSVTGVATMYSGNAQIAPRTADDVAAFTSTSTTPTLSVSPTSLSFSATGGTQTITVTVNNDNGGTLSTSGLSGILSASVDGRTVTVTAAENTGSSVSQTLTISLAGGNSVTVPVTVSGATSGETQTISIDFTSKDNYPSDFPSSSATAGKEATEYTIDGQNLVLSGSGYYLATSSGSVYLIVGKTGAYIEVPAVSGKKLVKVNATTRNGASTNVSVGIMDTEGNTVSGGEAFKWSGSSDYVYSYTLSGTAINTKYRIQVTNSYNAQFTNLELIYE